MEKAAIKGKSTRIVATSGWNAEYGGLEGAMYVRMALAALAKHPVDMLVFEMAREGRARIRLAGYDLATNSVLDEKTVACSFDSLPIKKFFFKVDDYGNEYVGTFLFPSEY